MLLKLDKFGSNVPKEGVTPAEAVVLSHSEKGLPSHHVNAGGFPLHTIEDIKEAKELVLDSENVWRDHKMEEVRDENRPKDWPKTVKTPTTKARTDAQEFARLKRTYSAKMLEKLFPGASPKLPQTFDEVVGWAPADLKVVQASLPKPPTPPTEPPKK